MAGRLRETSKTSGRKRGMGNWRTVALQIAATAAGEQIKAALWADTFDGDARAVLRPSIAIRGRPSTCGSNPRERRSHMKAAAVFD
jgi:hypothetical protein